VSSASECAFGRESSQSRSFAQFVSLARYIQTRLEERRAREPFDRLLLSLDDRYHFAAAVLAGAWLEIEVEVGPSSLLDDVTLGPSPGVIRLTESPSALELLGDHLSAIEENLLTEGAPPRPDMEIDLSKMRVAFWTSGSQNEPRRFCKSARTLLSEADMLASFWEVRPGHRIVSAAPAHHIYGFLWGTLLPIFAGASFFRDPVRHGASILSALSETSARRLVAVPAQLAALESAWRASRGPHMQLSIVSSGAALDRNLSENLAELGTSIVEILGSTETGGIAFRDPTREVGFTALPGVTLDSTSDGHLRVRSPFLEDPTVPYVSADRIEFQGKQFGLLGRADRIIKLGAVRVSLNEVEERILRLPGIEEVRAIAIFGPSAAVRQLELGIVAVSTVHTSKTLRLAVCQALPPEFWPKRIRIVPHLPVDERGKTPQTLLLSLFDNVAELGSGASPRVSLGTPSRASHAAIEHALCFPDEAPCLVGHFPHNPVVPGAVLVAEAVVAPALAEWPDLGHLTALQTVRFLNPLGPEQNVSVQLTRLGSRVAFRLHSSGEVLVTGTAEFANPSEPRQNLADA
jgi:3-hydroxymyristoyl/3-hydroxydecanoyl-(acyl carrier protein) dehydratase